MPHVRHGAPRMQGETNEGWCIRYTGTNSSDTDSSFCKFDGLLFCVVHQDEIRRRRISCYASTQDLCAAREGSGAVRFVIVRRVPLRRRYDVNLMKRKIS